MAVLATTAAVLGWVLAPLEAGASSNMGSMIAMPSMAIAAPTPLSGGVSDGSISMAIVPMGHLGDGANTFYETFTSSGTKWSLTTPPAVATNGGLALSSPARGAVAVLPFYASRLTALSPLTNGQPSGEGAVVGPLTRSPSAVAADPTTGAVATLTARGTVQEQTSLSAGPRTITTLAALRSMSGASRCDVQAVTALAFEPNGELGLGVRCARSGTAAVMIQSGASTFSTLAIPAIGADAVVRLDPNGQGLTALVRTGGMRASLRSLSITGLTVLVSSRFSFMDLAIRSTAFSAPASGVSGDVVTLAGTRHAEAVVLTPGGRVAQVTSPLPLSTQAVVATTASPDLLVDLTAFEVNQGTATVAVYGPNGEWTTTEVHRVSIPYGSSE
jgi:hypothetical protein